MPPEKSSLSIRLTEYVVSLRSTPRHHDDDTLPPAIVRGLLALELAKPTKVSSIELELQAKATTRYVQGAGPSRTDVTEQYKVHSASTLLFKASSAAQRQRAASARPRVQFTGTSVNGSTPPHGGCLGTASDHWQAQSPINRSASLDPGSLRDRRQLITSRLDTLEMDDGSVSHQDAVSIDPAPPYLNSWPASQHTFLNADVHPSVADSSLPVAGSLRIPGQQGSPVLSRGVTPDIPFRSPTSSEHSIHDFAFSRSSSSIEELPEDEDEGEGRNVDTSSDNVAHYGLSRTTGSATSGRSSDHDRRGRSHSRFSLGSIVHVVDVVKERVRSRSPREASRPPLDEQGRGRSFSKGKGKAQAQLGTHGVSHVLPRIGVTEPLDTSDPNGDGWVMFPEGTYTYPILFTIPNNSPPTMRADFGSLIWKVKAELRRPSTFRSKMTAQKEVAVVRVPMHEESEEVEGTGVDLQKQWEDQLQYRVQIAGRGFPIGGKVPLQLTITPLAKIKVHSILTCLDERTQYFTKSKLQARSDAIRRSTLLIVKRNSLMERYSEPILPLVSDEPEAFHKSPLYRFLNPGEDESEVASSFMGPGPWTIRHELPVPDSCSVLQPSNQTKGSNVMVSHTLKITLRVEREEENKTAWMKKLYDIVIHIPIHILSCHCTSEWTSLPGYDEALRLEVDCPEDTLVCPCRTRSQAKAPKARRHSLATDTLPMTLGSMTSLASSSRAFDACQSGSLASRTRLHELLMSGLVSERGEAPPSYECFEEICG